MSLTNTKNTKHWAPIYRKCKNCSKAIYTKEKGEVYYQCSLYGAFKKDCNLKISERRLKKPEEILQEGINK